MLRLLPLLALALIQCTSPQRRSENLVHRRATELAPLARWDQTWCRLDAQLTQPAIARYRQVYPKEIDLLTAESLPYTWKATKRSCEITPLKRSPLLNDYQTLLNTALCVLAQTHLVNSPFEGLDLSAVSPREGRALIKTGDDRDLGIYVDPNRFNVETRTKSHGVLSVDYAIVDGRWLPTRMSQRVGALIIEVTELDYAPPEPGRERQLRGFSLGVGEQSARAHSRVAVSECQRY